MQLHEIARQMFSQLSREEMVQMAMERNACDNAAWIIAYKGDNVFEDAPVKFLSWAMAPHLSSADLRSANLAGAGLFNAALSNADLRGADLRGADLVNAVLSSADLRDANLRWADLREADLRDATYDEATRFPRRFAPQEHGMIEIVPEVLTDWEQFMPVNSWQRIIEMSELKKVLSSFGDIRQVSTNEYLPVFLEVGDEISIISIEDGCDQPGCCPVIIKYSVPGFEELGALESEIWGKTSEEVKRAYL